MISGLGIGFSSRAIGPSPDAFVGLIEEPSNLPAANDPGSWEQLRVDLVCRLSDVRLHRLNRSEPYHWTSLLVALFGLGFAVAGSSWRRSPPHFQGGHMVPRNRTE